MQLKTLKNAKFSTIKWKITFTKYLKNTVEPAFKKKKYSNQITLKFDAVNVYKKKLIWCIEFFC